MFKWEGTWVNLQLIHVDVWWKPTQQCEAIILPLKTKFKKESSKMKIIVKYKHKYKHNKYTGREHTHQKQAWQKCWELVNLSESTHEFSVPFIICL